MEKTNKKETFLHIKGTEVKVIFEYWEDGDMYVGQVKGYQNVLSQGKTLDNLKVNISDAFRCMISNIETDFLLSVKQLIGTENKNWPNYVRNQFAEARKNYNNWVRLGVSFSSGWFVIKEIK